MDYYQIFMAILAVSVLYTWGWVYGHDVGYEKARQDSRHRKSRK